ncbi:hypothetical protein [Bradyrhizobium japonicum]|uniref:hypothetical protein n=1 Tax=Bradyrhizobium japonicum TaxID=375 RepID=UPI00200BA536|nr:hypothetical protein [Bradyrhizobium japonicum]UQD96064.1 hypothetical protein JEY30_31475 [Bradyrhizobium japonicum]
MADPELVSRIMTEDEQALVTFAKSCLDGQPLSLVLSLLTHLLADALMSASDTEAEFDANLERAVEAVKGNKMFIQAAGATKQ